ncbi:MAG: type VI secretion system tip protein TssI/VgrG [Rubrivivax sp.]|nr:type VI secretion system tip protein TssI/VgrG [Rubrivivax sp.]
MPKPYTLTTPLPDGALRFHELSHSAGLSQLEQTRLSLLSDKPDLAPDELLGKPMGLAVEMREGVQRHICGYVTRFGLGRHQGRYFGYEAVVRPWLWFLTRTSDCRIFQNQTVPEIVEAVFKDHAAIANYEFKLVRSYRQRVYCVQYRETDFNFVARLLEDSGIYWYFEHADGSHKLVLVDAATSHAPMPGETRLPYYENAGQVPPDTEYVTRWHYSHAVKPGKTALTSYDFERPSTQLDVQQTLQREYTYSDQELFDFQGDYTQKDDGQMLADDRLEEQQCRFERLTGTTNAHALTAGQLFDLVKHPRDDQNAEYLCLQLQLTARQQPGESGGGPGELACTFAAMHSDQPFRPLRRTPKPFVQGPQTAVVVGPSGEEIFTDKYGRVKVQFHWDRYAKKDERSSCWVRVASPWAGKSFGFVQIPRMGQEVIVDFLEGDPDQPIITGRVYNAEQMPPWDLPANATQSGVLSRSSKGGAYGNANALRFEDKKGSEQVWLHAEKNQDIEVENDETHWVGHDRTKTIDHDETTHVKHDRTETVDNDETITVHHDRTERVDNDETLSIGHDRMQVIEHDDTKTVHNDLTQAVLNNRSRTVAGAESVRVAKTRTETVVQASFENVGGAKALSVGGGYQVSVGAAMNVTVGGLRAVEVGAASMEVVMGNRSVSVRGAESCEVGKDQSITVLKDMSHTVSGKRADAVKKEYTLTAKKVTVTAEDELVLVSGSAKIVLKKNGDIQVSGKKIDVKGSGDVIIKGSKIAEN